MSPSLPRRTPLTRVTPSTLQRSGPTPRVEWPRRIASLIAFVAATHGLAAQSYAPAVPFHDPVQRLFPVEAARVLATLLDAKARDAIAEVRYEAATSPEGETRWQLRWCDEKGVVLREAEVRTPAALLLSGPTYYRQVWTDVARGFSATEGGTARSPSDAPGSVTATRLAEAYWTALADPHATRLATLKAVLEREREFTGREPALAAAARAGGLVATAVPSRATGLVSLDGVLLARAAAWLAYAEGTGTTPTRPATEECWVPILWLARRPPGAIAAWGEPSLHAPLDAGSDRERAWWGALATHGDPLQLARRAGAEPRPARAVALLGIATVQTSSGATRFIEGLAELKADRRRSRDWADAYEYGPWVATQGSVESGHAAGPWPRIALVAWMQAMAEMPRELKAGARPAASATVEGLEEAADGLRSEDERLIRELRRARSMLEAGFAEGAGRLEPTKIVTEADLLNHGWETIGLQVAARQLFLERRFSDRAAAAQLRTTVLELVPSFGPFFTRRSQSDQPAPTPMGDALRCQRIERAGDALVFGSFRIPRPAGGVNSSEGREQIWRDFAQHGWLMTERLALATWVMASRVREKDAARTFARRALDEGGEPVAAALYSYLANTGSTSPVAHLREELERRLTPDRRAQLPLDLRRMAELPPLERALTLERRYWAFTDDSVAREAFGAYLEAGATTAAKRFFTRAAPLQTDAVGFSNTLGGRRVALALLERDEAAVPALLAMMQTYSSTDLATRATWAAYRQDWSEMARWGQAIQDRYGESATLAAMARTLLDFAPLAPALRDTAHPERAKALAHFATMSEWPTLQWFVIQQTGLSVEDAVTFLGGEGRDDPRQLMIHGLKGDAARLESAYAARLREGRPQLTTLYLVVVQHLRNQLAGRTDLADVPEVYPGSAGGFLTALREGRTMLEPPAR